MSSRRYVLDALRNAPVQPSPLPPLKENWLTYEDPLSEFCAAVERAAGAWLTKPAQQELETTLQDIEAYRKSKRVCALVPGVARHTVDLQRVREPHTLESLDVAVTQAMLGVAENGALWVTAQSAKERALLFLPQHLVVLLDVHRLVHNLHEAYLRLRPQDTVFGCFISGPSKTADIEQALVVGAHGPRSLTVVLVSDPKTQS